jgi:hypothetical protein
VLDGGQVEADAAVLDLLPGAVGQLTAVRGRPADGLRDGKG